MTLPHPKPASHGWSLLGFHRTDEVPRAGMPRQEGVGGAHFGLGASLQDIQELPAEAFQLGEADPGGRSQTGHQPSLARDWGSTGVAGEGLGRATGTERAGRQGHGVGGPGQGEPAHLRAGRRPWGPSGRWELTERGLVRGEALRRSCPGQDSGEKGGLAWGRDLCPAPPPSRIPWSTPWHPHCKGSQGGRWGRATVCAGGSS